MIGRGNGKGEEDRRFELMTSKFAMDLNPGSKESLDLLQALIDTSNREIFRGDLQILVEYKWEQTESWVIFHSLVYFMFALGVIINHFLSNQILKVVLIVIGFILLIRECLQIYKKISQYF